jgi:hypothetical protein
MRSCLVAVILCVVAGVAHAQTLHGRVIGVTDGDTITPLDADKIQDNESHDSRTVGTTGDQSAKFQ